MIRTVPLFVNLRRSFSEMPKKYLLSRVFFQFIFASFYSKIIVSSGVRTKLSQAVEFENLKWAIFYDFTDNCQKFHKLPCRSGSDNRVLKQYVRVRISSLSDIFVISSTFDRNSIPVVPMSQCVGKTASKRDVRVQNPAITDQFLLLSDTFEFSGLIFLLPSNLKFSRIFSRLFRT